ncbi:MAG TPA: HNH endonuclease [Phycisphaerae bacterium]|nr:HNH endonuclease [Phycisphaerae bacterium]
MWKGGRYKDSHGYVHIWVGPRCYKLEHRLVMENALGRTLLSSETVHHLNGMTTDNRPENLSLFQSTNAHTKTHWLEAGVDGFGRAHKKKPMATCHPDRPHNARGLCGPCYWRMMGRKYRLERPERLRRIRQRCQEKDPVAFLEKRRVAAKKKYHENPAIMRARRRIYYQAHIEQERERARNYQRQRRY